MTNIDKRLVFNEILSKHLVWLFIKTLVKYKINMRNAPSRSIYVEKRNSKKNYTVLKYRLHQLRKLNFLFYLAVIEICRCDYFRMPKAISW